MHEDLLGYLLGALEPDEMERVAQLLRDDPAAREELAKIERSLEPLEDHYEPVEPPPSDLVARTLANLPPLPPPDLAEVPATETRHDFDDAPGGDSLSADLIPMQESVEASKGSSMTWIDWAGGAVAAAVLLGLLLPSLAQGRFEARNALCQDNLRRIGATITQFVIRSPQHRLPAVAASGPEAFAGVYAVRLHDTGLLNDPTVRLCPSIDPPSDETMAALEKLISIEDLHSASVDQLRQIQKFVGGHYAYTLGVIDNNELRSPRFESRSSFAVMSDAPLIGVSDSEIRADRMGHSGRGINVLYEDGRVQFISLSQLDSMPDHPLFNHQGKVEAGVNIDDASLAPSWRPPFANVRQR